MNEQKHFIRGTIILAIANVIAKFLGAVFKIPLTYILEEEGMAIFNTASTVYSMFLTFVIAGIPLATSRLVSENTALNKNADAIKVVTASRRLLTLFGFLVSSLLFILAEPLATAMKDPLAATAIKIISPSVLFVAIGSSYKSYFQGTGRMVPTAISQVIEAFIRLGVGYVLALQFSKYGLGITAAAATSGVTAGEIIATFILAILYLFQKVRVKEKSNARYKKIYSMILSVAIPMLICSITLSAVNILDAATVRNQLLKITFTPESAEQFLLRYSSYTTLFDDLFTKLKLSQEGARWLYGAYSGYALTVFHLPIGIIATLSVSILPLIAGNLAKNNLHAVRHSCNIATNLTLFCAVPACILFITSSDVILNLLFKNTASAHMLKLVSPCLIFLSLSQIFTSILHAAGKIYEPFIIQLIGMGIKISGNLILVKIPALNIDGAILSSIITFFFIALSEGILLYKLFGVKHSFKTLLAPFISAIPMFIILKLTYNPLSFIFSNSLVAFLIGGFSAGIAYLLAFSVLAPDGLFFLLRKK